jgi:hypothetical protein
MRNLWPSIEVIASNLQNKSATPLHFPDKEEAGSQAEAGNAEMPAFIRAKIRQRIATRAAQFNAQPQAGQIWRFDDTAENLAPLCVLLDQAQQGQHWSGWLVAPETDYASNKDVLLEPQDEPFDPFASMVQTWNPVTVDVSKGARVLAQLAPQRLQAIREIAQGQCEEGGGARAGFVAPLKTHSGATVLSGTRITHPEDPRRQYQQLYRAAAQTLRQLHGLMPPGATVIPLPDKNRFMRKVGWSLAVSIMLAQAAIIANLMRGQTDAGKTPLEQAAEYRAAPQAPTNFAYLEVYFKPDAKEVAIRKLLTQLNAAIVDGPGEFGQYRVRVKAETAQEAIGQIKESKLADSVRADE